MPRSYDNDNRLIQMYFERGYKYKVILNLLSVYHGIEMSVRTFKRRLVTLNLRRHGQSSLIDVWSAINAECRGPGGYRSMTQILKSKYHLRVTHETTRLVLRQINPVAVDLRRRHRLVRRTYWASGPNDIWHVDGYDKLVKYGFGISGCIDGFSRRIMWLKCAASNHQPGIIATYFVETTQMVGGYPRRLRTDCGTENVLMASIQAHVRNSQSAHMYGSSPANQRIEAWWAFLRRNRTQWWLDLFSWFEEIDLFHIGNRRETEMLRFCFMALLQDDLSQVTENWNAHRIRPAAGSRCPPGVPDELYFLPPHGSVDCLQRPITTLPGDLLDRLHMPTVCETEDVEAYLAYLCVFHNWARPASCDEGIALYRNLHSCFVLPD